MSWRVGEGHTDTTSRRIVSKNVLSQTGSIKNLGRAGELGPVVEAPPFIVATRQERPDQAAPEKRIERADEMRGS